MEIAVTPSHPEGRQAGRPYANQYIGPFAIVIPNEAKKGAA
jgi:hypothetical protein